MASKKLINFVKVISAEATIVTIVLVLISPFVFSNEADEPVAVTLPKAEPEFRQIDFPNLGTTSVEVSTPAITFRVTKPIDPNHFVVEYIQSDSGVTIWTGSNFADITVMTAKTREVHSRMTTGRIQEIVIDVVVQSKPWMRCIVTAPLGSKTSYGMIMNCS